MFYRLRTTITKKYFDYKCRGVFSTAPVVFDENSNVVVLSQVYHPDVTMFMLAAKSFMRFVKPRELVLVDDGLSEDDKEIISAHFPVVRFVCTADVVNSVCPKGGCWERFLTVSDLADKDYVIQLDADTLTLAMPEEVRKCIENGVGFTLGTDTGHKKVSLMEASAFAEKDARKHIQIDAEKALIQLPLAKGQHYVRGCAGFAGYPAKQMHRVDIEEFSRKMSGLLGSQRWREWGSEQFTSNYFVANMPNSHVLSPHIYPFWKPELNIKEARFVHFFGTYRFKGGGYIDSARKVITELNEVAVI